MTRLENLILQDQSISRNLLGEGDMWTSPERHQIPALWQSLTHGQRQELSIKTTCCFSSKIALKFLAIDILLWYLFLCITSHRVTNFSLSWCYFTEIPDTSQGQWYEIYTSGFFFKSNDPSSVLLFLIFSNIIPNFSWIYYFISPFEGFVDPQNLFRRGLRWKYIDIPFVGTITVHARSRQTVH